MAPYSFALATLEDVQAVLSMREESNRDLSSRLGPGRWTGSTRVPSIRERIKGADPETLRRSTLFVARDNNIVVGSVVVSTVAPGFWRRHFWAEPNSSGLGVFGLVVCPEQQRRGIGRFIMTNIELLASDRSIPFVRLDAFQSNPVSNAFYHGIGYSERATIDLRGTGLVLFEKCVRPASEG